MPWCPKCKSPQDISVSMSVSGFLYADETLDTYPEIDGQAAELTDEAYCMTCEYQARLVDFQPALNGEEESNSTTQK